MTGAYSRTKGATCERTVASFFRDHGFSSAERAVVTGFATASRTSADTGDIRGVPGLCVEVKNYAGGLSQSQRAQFLAKLQTQRGQDRMGVLVEKVQGKADPARWLVHLYYLDLESIMTHGSIHKHPGTLPVTIYFGDFMELFASYWG